MSWRHYQYGMAFLGRQHTRAQLAAAEAHRIAGATEDSFRAVSADLRRTILVPLRTID